MVQFITNSCHCINCRDTLNINCCDTVHNEGRDCVLLYEMGKNTFNYIAHSQFADLVSELYLYDLIFCENRNQCIFRIMAITIQHFVIPPGTDHCWLGNDCLKWEVWSMFLHECCTVGVRFEQQTLGSSVSTLTTRPCARRKNGAAAGNIQVVGSCSVQCHTYATAVIIAPRANEHHQLSKHIQHLMWIFESDYLEKLSLLNVV